jgi:hypothetical protein
MTLPGQNWFIPRQLGGLGLPMPREFVCTRGQKKMATFLHVAPDPSFRIPSYGEREEASYLGLIRLQETLFSEVFGLEWADERQDDSPLSFLPKYLEEMSWETSLLEKDRSEVNAQWNRAWKQYTDIKLDCLNMDTIKNYKNRFVKVRKDGPLPTQGEANDILHFGIRQVENLRRKKPLIRRSNRHRYGDEESFEFEYSSPFGDYELTIHPSVLQIEEREYAF